MTNNAQMNTPASAQPAIQVEHVVKNYGSFRAVDNISFDVYNGEIFAMLGPNGAGKSTTIRMILDIIKPDSGTIRVLGKKMDDSLKDRLGYLPEERGLYRNVKVVDMMAYLGMLKGMSSTDAHRRAMELLERLNLAENAKSKVSELSKGMQQKVQFAVTVIHNPSVVIIDEPFSGLDPVNTLDIKQLIIDMRNRGTAVIMSTHQMNQVEEMADRLLMINKGKQALYGKVTDVRREYAQHAVIVEGTGDWSHLRGVERVQPVGSNGHETLLYMRPEISSNDLLAEIAATPDVEVERFELAVPSMNDIFIRVAGNREANLA